MAEAAVVAVAGAAAVYVSSSYRVKFKKDEFVELAQIAQPQRIYRVRNMFFSAFDGFVMYSTECTDGDFKQKTLKGIEFSNEPWAKG